MAASLHSVPRYYMCLCGASCRRAVRCLIDRILRLGKRRAPRLYAIARDAYRKLRPRRPASESVRTCYDAISRLNIVDNVAKVVIITNPQITNTYFP